MRIKRKPNKLVYISLVLLVGLGVYAYFTVFGPNKQVNNTNQVENQSSTGQVSEQSQPQYQPTPNDNCQPSADKTKPYLVTIASVGIENTCVEEVGATSAGALGDPDDYMKMGWYKGSPTPDNSGAGIYVCHTSFSQTVKALCDVLHKLENGADIVVEIASGQRLTYTVKQLKTLPLADVNMQEFDSVVDGASRGLSIMTCAGTYNQKTGGFSHRLLIWATLND